jgi:hypothetical protein
MVDPTLNVKPRSAKKLRKRYESADDIEIEEDEAADADLFQQFTANLAEDDEAVSTLVP